MGNGYDNVTAEDVMERGQRVLRAESDENDLHPVASRAVVEVHARTAQDRASRQ